MLHSAKRNSQSTWRCRRTPRSNAVNLSTSCTLAMPKCSSTCWIQVQTRWESGCGNIDLHEMLCEALLRADHVQDFNFVIASCCFGNPYPIPYPLVFDNELNAESV